MKRLRCWLRREHRYVWMPSMEFTPLGFAANVVCEDCGRKEWKHRGA